MVCASVPLTKSVRSVSVSAEIHLEATESNKDLCPLGPSWSVVAPPSVPNQAISAVTKCAKKPAAIGELPCTQRSLAPGVDKIKHTVVLASFISAKPAFSSQCRSPSVSLHKKARRFSNSVSHARCSGDVDDEGAFCLFIRL